MALLVANIPWSEAEDITPVIAARLGVAPGAIRGQ